MKRNHPDCLVFILIILQTHTIKTHSVICCDFLELFVAKTSLGYLFRLFAVNIFEYIFWSYLSWVFVFWLIFNTLSLTLYVLVPRPFQYLLIHGLKNLFSFTIIFLTVSKSGYHFTRSHGLSSLTGLIVGKNPHKIRWNLAVNGPIDIILDRWNRFEMLIQFSMVLEVDQINIWNLRFSIESEMQKLTPKNCTLLQSFTMTFCSCLIIFVFGFVKLGYMGVYW